MQASRHTYEQGRLGYYQLLSKEVTTICIDFCVLAPSTPCGTSPHLVSTTAQTTQVFVRKLSVPGW